tara:strand:+ start:293 stop:1003 length:711 start_codon:yes stop_codon:yes gene_type:complete
MKKCTKCKVEKELTEFYKHNSNKDGFNNQCKSCIKEYDKKYKKATQEQRKEWRQANKEKINEKRKEYYQANKEKEKEYYQANKEKIKEQRKEYRKANKEQSKKYYKANKEYYKEYCKEYQKERRAKDPLFKMTGNLRNRTSVAFRNKGYTKNTKTQEMLGVDWEVCKAHIERQFTKGMSWENQGDWHIDHIIPLSSANTEQELKKLCHYSNLQPLWAVDNIIKSAKINGQQNRFRF